MVRICIAVFIKNTFVPSGASEKLELEQINHFTKQCFLGTALFAIPPLLLRN